MNGYTESDAKVKARWESRKRRDDAILTARANHAACLLAETMRDCDNCKFQPDESGLPFLALSDTVAIAVTPKLDPMLERLNKAAGYDVVTAICTTSPERKEWEAQYLAKRAAHVEKYWSNR